MDINGFAITYRAGSWPRPISLSPPGAPFFHHFTSCPADNFCLSVGTDGDTYAYRDGDWRPSAGVSLPQPAQHSNAITALSCPAAPACVAVDALGNAFRYDGSAWSGPTPADPARPPAPGALLGVDHEVSCATEAMCMIIGTDGTWSRYNGRTWSTPSRLEHAVTQELQSISCATTTFCAAVDDSGNAFVYNGHTWSAPIPTPSQAGQVTPTGFSSISCPRPRFCVATDGTQTWTLS